MKSLGYLEGRVQDGDGGDEVSRGQTAEARASVRCSVVEDGMSQTGEKGAARWGRHGGEETLLFVGSLHI